MCCFETSSPPLLPYFFGIATAPVRRKTERTRQTQTQGKKTILKPETKPEEGETPMLGRLKVLVPDLRNE